MALLFQDQYPPSAIQPLCLLFSAQQLSCTQHTQRYHLVGSATLNRFPGSHAFIECQCIVGDGLFIRWQHTSMVPSIDTWFTWRCHNGAHSLRFTSSLWYSASFGEAYIGYQPQCPRWLYWYVAGVFWLCISDLPTTPVFHGMFKRMAFMLLYVVTGTLLFTRVC